MNKVNVLSFVVVASNNDIKLFYVSFDTPVADRATTHPTARRFAYTVTHPYIHTRTHTYIIYIHKLGYWTSLGATMHLRL